MSAFNLPPDCSLRELQPKIVNDNWFWEEMDRRRDQVVDEELGGDPAQNGELMPIAV